LDQKTSREILLRWLLALGCFALLIHFFSPPWGAFNVWSRVPEMSGLIEVRRGASVLLQAAHPGAPVVDPLHGAIQWRLLFPVIGWLFNLPAPALFGLAHVGCVVVLAFVVALLRRRGAKWFDAGLVALTLGAGSWYFTSVSWLGYYDSWLVLGVLVVAFAESRWSVWAACIWAPWVDERFVLAAPLALLCRWLDRSGKADAAPAIRGADGAAPSGAAAPQVYSADDWKRELTVSVGLLAAFVAVRLGLLAGMSGTTATVGGYLATQKPLDTPLLRVGWGAWEGLRAGWWLAVLALVLQWQRARAHALWLGVALAVTVLVGLGTAQDLSRSLMMVLPVAALGAVQAVAAPWRWVPVALRVGAGAALLLPAHQVMTDRVNPVFGLYHELAALRSSPAAVMPEMFELRGIHAMEVGDFARAEADLTLAVKLAGNPAGPCKQRGLLYASQGRWADARRDFATMVEHEPRNPDAWFMRAQAGLALGDRAAAQADMRQALTVAPKNWAARPDVARFSARLQQAAGTR
jgi:hypothetical protein